MLTFLSVALLIYGSMHAYALGKVWMAFPHSSGLAAALTLTGIVLTFSPLLVWFLERQSWHCLGKLYVDGRKLYASGGTGTWGPPIRLFAPPEITLITIAGSNKPSPANAAGTS